MNEQRVNGCVMSSFLAATLLLGAAPLARADLTPVALGETVAPLPVVDLAAVLSGHVSVGVHLDQWDSDFSGSYFYRGEVFRNSVDQTLAFVHRFYRTINDGQPTQTFIPHQLFDVYEMSVGNASFSTATSAVSSAEYLVGGMAVAFDWSGTPDSMYFVVRTNATEWMSYGTSMLHQDGSHALGSVAGPAGPPIPAPASMLVGAAGAALMGGRRRRTPPR
ncbi:MAG: hypothetical protein JNK58_05065 [Phycisphaerae bacterium]|nr:hypothetical protein [Phycisphaerae bacterium]